MKSGDKVKSGEHFPDHTGTIVRVDDVAEIVFIDVDGDGLPDALPVTFDGFEIAWEVV